MALRKNERLMNVLFTLMSTQQFLTRAQIKDALDDYRTLSDQAFERKFERDKEDLRELGVPIEMGSHDPLGPPEGYRINRSAIELPHIEVTPEESAVIGLAGTVWQNTAMSRSVTTAIAKLKSVGIGVDTSTLVPASTQIFVDEEDFDTFVDAAHRRREVTFDYSDVRGAISARRVQPWGLLSWRGHWYVGGQDVDRGEPRLFRLSRILGQAMFASEAGAFEPPEGASASVRDIATMMFGGDPDRVAILDVSEGRCQYLRRHAGSCGPGANGRDRLEVPFSRIEELVGEIISQGSDVQVIEPDDLRDAVVSALTRMVVPA